MTSAASFICGSAEVRKSGLRQLRTLEADLGQHLLFLREQRKGEGDGMLGVNRGVEIGFRFVEREHPEEAVAMKHRHAEPRENSGAHMQTTAKGTVLIRVADDQRTTPEDHFAVRDIDIVDRKRLAENDVEIRKADAAEALINGGARLTTTQAQMVTAMVTDPREKALLQRATRK